MFNDLPSEVYALLAARRAVLLGTEFSRRLPTRFVLPDFHTLSRMFAVVCWG